jgi:LuxR family maltose regulon positive regulatory protein
MFRNYLVWVEAIPKELLHKKPRLEIVKIFMLHEMGRYQERDEQLKFVDELLGPLPEDLSECSSGTIINHGILASLKSIIYASGHFLIEETYKFSKIATDLLSEEYSLWRTLASGAIHFLDRAVGNYEKSIAGHQNILRVVTQSGFVFQTFIASSVLTKSYLETGQLKLAMITCQKALELDDKHGASFPFAKFAYILMGESMYQAGQLGSAEAYVESGLEHIVRHGDVYSIIDGYSLIVRIQLGNHDPQEALALIEEMKVVIKELSLSSNAMKIVNAWEAYTLLMAGRVDQAAKWIDEPGFDQLEGSYLFDLDSHSYVGIYRVSQNPITIYTDFIKVTLARLLLAIDRLDEGLDVIEETLESMPEGGRSIYKIESLIIKSLLLRALNRKPEAVSIFHQAIRLAAKEGFAQVFMSEGPAIKELLEEVKDIGLGDIEEQVFILRLLENIHLDSRRHEKMMAAGPVNLTPREIEVLKCLATGLSYSQAAEQLSISRNTLKTHTKRIYQKLGVNGLLQAINKAKELGDL